MSKELIEALTELANKFGLAIDWTSQNAMPYLQELMNRIIRFEIVTSIMWLIWGLLHLLSAVLWIKAIRYANKKIQDDKWGDWDFYKWLFVLGMAITIIIGLLITITQIEDILMCNILPEAIVLRYIHGVQ